MDWLQIIFEAACIWSATIAVTYVTIKYLSQKHP